MLRIIFALVVSVLAGGGLLFAQAAEPSASLIQPKVQAVYFHADWCSNCLVLQPKLEQAKNETTKLAVQHLTLDFTNPQTWDKAMQTALDENIVATYNAYAGTTGMVVMVAADTGERIDCVNKLFSVEAIKESFKRAVSRVNMTAAGARDTGSVVCPPARVRP